MNAAGDGRQAEHQLLELVRRDRVPGLQYVAVSSTRTLLDFAAGFAAVGSRPMTADTTLMAYSMSKTITACAVLQLVERGKLGIDDSVSRYISWQPYGDEITVRRLLSHTAGIPNPLPLRWVHSVASDPAFAERDALMKILGSHPRLAHKPGVRFAYSNIGYWLLGALVEEVTGETFATHVQSSVFTPLGFGSRKMTYRIPDATRHASGYLERRSFINLVKPLVIDRSLVGQRAGRWVEILPHYVNGPAFGGIVAPAAAFASFLQDQLRESSRVLGASGRGFFYEQQCVAGRDIPMTLGWHIGARGEQRYYFKEGGGAGFHSMMRLYKGRDIGTAIMVNATTFNVARVLDTVDALLGAAIE